LLSTTPASPEYSEHRRYAEIVLEASIRRQVLQAGAHIEHTALGYADDAGDHALEALDRVLDATTTRLAALTRRLGESTEFMSAISAALNSSSLRATHGAERTTPPTADVLNASTTPTTTAHDLSALNLDLPTPSLARLRYAEKALIGGCITEPWLREIAQHRLRPEDFTQPEVAATWLVLTDLVERGEPIDFVLVAAEQQRRGEHPDFGPGLEPLQLRILSMRADVVSGSRAISEVIRGALSRATEHAGGALAEVGANQRQTSAELLEAARTAVRRIDAIRWRLAGKPPPTRDRSLTPGTAPQVPTRADSTPPRPAPRLVPRALPPMPRRVGRTR
jgi:replicative DNA helicase